MNIYTNFICNSPKLELTQVSSGWMVQQPSHEILLGHKKEWTIEIHTIWIDLQIIVIREEAPKIYVEW